jgi:hypothetical protein
VSRFRCSTDQSYYDFDDIDMSFFVDKHVSDDDDGWSSDEDSFVGRMPLLPTASASDDVDRVASARRGSRARPTSEHLTGDTPVALANREVSAAAAAVVVRDVGPTHQTTQPPKVHQSVRGRLNASLQLMRSLSKTNDDQGARHVGAGAIQALSQRRKDLKAMRRHTTGVPGIGVAMGWSNRQQKEFMRHHQRNEADHLPNEEEVGSAGQGMSEEQTLSHALKRTRDQRGIRPTRHKPSGLDEILADVRAEERERRRIQSRRELQEEQGVQSSLFGDRVPQGMTRGRFVTFSGDTDALDRLGMDFFEGRVPDGF